MLDVGTGDGLIAFGALDLVGPEGRVVFSDVSVDLLEHCRRVAKDIGVVGRCQFVRASAEDLGPIAPVSTDVVTMRSVLIYVANKAAALAEFHRVLRPGGRLSIFEPINRYFGDDPAVYCGFDVSAVGPLAAKIKALYRRIQPWGTDPMTDFDERDLLELVQSAGFDEVRLDLEVRIEPTSWVTGWDAFKKISPNPRVPTTEEAMSLALTPEEAREFEAHLAPLVDAGAGIDRSARAFLSARKPESSSG